MASKFSYFNCQEMPSQNPRIEKSTPILSLDRYALFAHGTRTADVCLSEGDGRFLHHARQQAPLSTTLDGFYTFDVVIDECFLQRDQDWYNSIPSIFAFLMTLNNKQKWSRYCANTFEGRAVHLSLSVNPSFNKRWHLHAVVLGSGRA